MSAWGPKSAEVREIVKETVQDGPGTPTRVQELVHAGAQIDQGRLASRSCSSESGT